VGFDVAEDKAATMEGTSQVADCVGADLCLEKCQSRCIGVGGSKKWQSHSGGRRGKKENNDRHTMFAKQGELTAVEFQCGRKQRHSLAPITIERVTACGTYLVRIARWANAMP